MNTEPTQLTYITTCKGRLAHLKQTLPRIVSQPNVSCIVVDYDCPDGTSKWVSANFPQVKIVHVENTAGFHAARARNLGAKLATTPWLSFFDADILLDLQFVSVVLPALKQGHHYRPHPPSRQTWGSFICARSDYQRVGGYDEIYRGWGTEDDDIYEMLQIRGVKRAAFSASLISEIPHPDEMRTRFHSVDMVMSHRINQYYKHIKFDAMQLLQGTLPEHFRRTIYNLVEQRVMALQADRKASATVNINLPAYLLSPPPADRSYTRVETALISRRLQYMLKIEAVSPTTETIETTEQRVPDAD